MLWCNPSANVSTDQVVLTGNPANPQSVLDLASSMMEPEVQIGTASDQFTLFETFFGTRSNIPSTHIPRTEPTAHHLCLFTTLLETIKSDLSMGVGICILTNPEC